MTQDTPGWIIVRVANKGRPDEFIVPQTYKPPSKCGDAVMSVDVTIFWAEQAANQALQRCKLGRPNSNLELRQAVSKVEVLT